jgi:hypothetical protein
MKKIVLILGCLAAVFIFTIIMAGPCYSADNVIYACIRKDNGQTRIVSGPGNCGRAEVSVYWNQVGPKGDKGDKGDQGPSGEQGPPGTFDITKVYTYFCPNTSDCICNQTPNDIVISAGVICPMEPPGELPPPPYNIWLISSSVAISEPLCREEWGCFPINGSAQLTNPGAAPFGWRFNCAYSYASNTPTGYVQLISTLVSPQFIYLECLTP